MVGENRNRRRIAPGHTVHGDEDEEQRTWAFRMDSGEPPRNHQEALREQVGDQTLVSNFDIGGEKVGQRWELNELRKT